MGEKYENGLKEELLKVLDQETDKKAEEMDTGKVGAVLDLLEYLGRNEKETESDSLDKFIARFNKMHHTALTADINRLERQAQLRVLFVILMFMAVLPCLCKLFVRKKEICERDRDKIEMRYL